SRVRCFRFALGSRAGSVSIARKQDSQTYSLRYPAALDDLETETVTVNTIDAFTATHKVDRIDLLKIDTEGYEQRVLLGAVQVLSENRVGPILLECTLDRADAVHTCFTEVANFLAGFDYHLVAIYDQITWREPIRLAYFN